MKTLTTLALLAISTLGYAQELKYDCRPASALKKPIMVRGNRLVSIDKLTSTMGSNINLPEFKLSGKYISEEQIINRRGNDKLVPEAFEDTFVLNDVRDGMVIDLKAQDNNDNKLSFLYTILSLKEMEVTTAGPIPEGTFNQKVDLILITNGATVNTIHFDCKVENKY